MQKKTFIVINFEGFLLITEYAKNNKFIIISEKSFG